MIPSYLLFLWGFAELTREHSLELPVHVERPVFAASGKNTFWIADEMASWVFRLNLKGQVIQGIDFGRGIGPGQLKAPRNIFELKDQNALVVVEKFGRTTVFNLDSGTYRSEIINFLPYDAVFSTPDSLLMFATSMAPDQQPLCQQYNLNGAPLESWEISLPTAQSDNAFTKPAGFATGPNQTMYVALQIPTVLVYPYKEKQPIEWRMNIPRSYTRGAINADTSQLNLRDSASLAAITNMFMLGEEHLVVTWKGPKGLDPRFEIYNLATRKPVLVNQPYKGTLIGTLNQSMVKLSTKNRVQTLTTLHFQ